MSGLEPGTDHTVSRRIVDRRRGNSYRAWVDMGEPQPPDPSQVARLRRVSRPGVELPDSARADSGGTVAIRFEVESHSVTLVELTPVA